MALVLVVGAPATLAQGTYMVQPTPGDAEVPAWVKAQALDPNDPRVQEYARQQKRRVAIEKELYKLRATYFQAKKTEIRQAGIAKLRTYTDPAIYPSLLKIFAKQDMDVRGAILDMLADAKTDEADATLTWGAIFDESKPFRDAAAGKLRGRIKEIGHPSDRIKSVVASALAEGNDGEMKAAAGVAQTLNLWEAIPMLISAQLGGQTTAETGGGGETSLAWILVGTQTAFVSNLTPVVGDNAVGFDPQVSVITEGTYLRVIDAVVVTYRTEIHTALVGLSSANWDKPTDYLGWDNAAWRKWYADEFRPYMAGKLEAEKAKAATPAPGPSPAPAPAGDPGSGSQAPGGK